MAADRWRVFVDTNVLVAGMLSQKGAPATILDLGEAEEIRLVVSRQILVEAEFVRKFPALTERYRVVIKHLQPILVDDPPLTIVRQASQVIHPDDAPILAAAKIAGVDYLVTSNTKHFSPENVRAFLPAPILTPAEFLTRFQTFWEHLA